MSESPRLYAGTSGFSYKEWKGPFYPEKLKNDEMLAFYGSQLPTVEINNTFYRMPKVEVLDKWAASVPDDFRFVLKASRRITHQQRLVDSEDSVNYLVETASTLGAKLGPMLFQLPPFLKKNVEVLKAFLDILPPGLKAAFEFRNDTWWDDEVYAALREGGASLCLADTGEERDPPMVATADWGYLRLRRPDYDRDQLKHWVGQIEELGWKEAFVFFKHEDDGAGPRMARQFLEVGAEG